MTTDAEYEVFESHLKALGKVVFAWNDLLETLGVLFASVLYPDRVADEMALAVWHAIKSDTAQIDMLRAAVGKINMPDQKRQDAVRADLEWLCSKARALSDDRNNAVHAPLTYKTEDGEIVGIVPSDFFGHPRAVRLTGKDLLRELAWQADSAHELKMYALRVMLLTRSDPSNPLPDRPELPNRGQRNDR